MTSVVMLKELHARNNGVRALQDEIKSLGSRNAIAPANQESVFPPDG